jgi:diacylglycerol O-acyltransferase
MGSMTTPVALSGNDSLWLKMDTPENLMIIESVMWFDGRLDLARVARVIETRMLALYPVFMSRPQLGGPMGPDHWVPDEHFSLDRHLSSHEVGDGDLHTIVTEFMAEHMSQQLPMDRPLWHTYVLQGNGFSVLVQRFHHSIADGTALVRVMLEMTSDGPNEDFGEELPAAAAPDSAEAPTDRSPAHPWEAAGEAALPEPVPTGRDHLGRIDQATRRLGHVVTLPLAAGAAVTRPTAGLLHLLDPYREGSWVSRLADQALGTADAVDKLLVGTAPDALPFGRPGREKRADWATPISLAQVKSVAHAHGATVNDVMLALLSGALRRYVLARGELPVDVVTMIPVNLRPWDAPLPEHLGNKFALVALDLPLAEATAAARLTAAKSRMDVIKNGPESVLTFGLAHAIGSVGSVTALASRQLTSFFSNKAFGVTTNVPGPDHARYFAGRRVVGVLGWVPGASHQTLGTSIFSYDGAIWVGFKADATVLPDVGNLVACFEAEVADLLAEFTPQPPTAAKQAATKQSPPRLPRAAKDAAV